MEREAQRDMKMPSPTAKKTTPAAAAPAGGTRLPSAGGWPHALAWALACGTFPLVWFGGMVTTWKAGMAVPDWPSSFQHWLFLPLAKWFSTWHVVLEHTHRELGKLVGLLTIALMVALLRRDDRRWMRVLGVVALVAVCYQGALGGARVMANEVLLANLHGCTAPLFFALASALVVFTARAWRAEDGAAADRPAAAGRLRRLSLVLPMVIYIQIVLGAQLRHLLPDQRVGWFPWFTWLHLINAAVIVAGLAGLGKIVWRDLAPQAFLRRRTLLLISLMTVQTLLGLGTWVTKYGWPDWAARLLGPWDYTVSAGGLVQGLMVTAHVAVGSLTLVTALSLALWSRRLLSRTT